MARNHKPDSARRNLIKVAGAAALLTVLPLSVGSVAAAGRRLRIGIIGSGHVGSALGEVWAKAGHSVLFSSRNLDNDTKLAARVGANARAGTPQQAAAFGEVILLAVPYSAFPELIESVGSELKGKVVINASNPFPERDGKVAEQARAQGAGLFDAQALSGCPGRAGIQRYRLSSHGQRAHGSGKDWRTDRRR